MPLFTFAMMMLKREYKKSIFYSITLLFVVAMSFIFFNIINNEHLVSPEIMKSGQGWSNVSVPLSTGLSFLIICFCCFMVLFASDFYLSRKTKEFALLATSGINAIGTTKYATYQILAMLCLVTPIGGLFGMFIMPFINRIMYDYLSIPYSIYYIPSDAVLHTILTLLCMVVLIMIITGGFIYRNDIQTLLSDNKRINAVTMKDKANPWIFISLYVIGLIMMVMDTHSASSYVFPTVVGMIGVIQLVKYGIPKMIKNGKDKKWIVKRYALIYTSNLSSAMQNAVFLITCTVMAVTVMIAILASQQDNPREYITAIISYLVIIILLVTSVVYKLCMDIQSRAMLFQNLWKIGYTKKELSIIVRNEVMFFYVLLLILPMPYILFIGIRFIVHNEMTIVFLISVILAYTIPTILSIIITYRTYVKSVIKPLEKGV